MSGPAALLLLAPFGEGAGKESGGGGGGGGGSMQRLSSRSSRAQKRAGGSRRGLRITMNTESGDSSEVPGQMQEAGVEAGEAADMRARIYAGMKRFFHTKSTQGLLSNAVRPQSGIAAVRMPSSFQLHTLPFPRPLPRFAPPRPCPFHRPTPCATQLRNIFIFTGAWVDASQI